METLIIDRIQKAAKKAIEIAAANTTTGNWVITEDDLAGELDCFEYVAYYGLLIEAIEQDERVLDLDPADLKLNIILGTDFCPSAEDPEEF